MAEIAIVDDEKVLVESLGFEISALGHEVRSFHRGAPFVEYIQSYEPDLIFLDLRLPDIHGLDLLNQVRVLHPHIPTVIITAHGDMESAIQALKRGAYDYIIKPFELDEIIILIQRALDETKLLREVKHHRMRTALEPHLTKFIGASAGIKKLLDTVHRVARVDDTTILLRGESGTGKDLLAKAIHNLSRRADRQFIEVNCAGIPDRLLESELFGYEKGAFTDAKSRKTGLAELADGGTLFLDEVGDLPLQLQAKLLRFLETRSFRRIGGARQIPVDVRIISATNMDLEGAIEDGSFRADLYYRLNVMPLVIPPLRQRSTDITLLAEHFLDHFCRKFRRRSTELGAAARRAFLAYSWPGNVRELRNLIERLVILCDDGIIDWDDLPKSLQDSSIGDQVPPGLHPAGKELLEEKLAAYERRLIREALEAAAGVKAVAAERLGISRYSLLRRLRRLFP